MIGSKGPNAISQRHRRKHGQPVNTGRTTAGDYRSRSEAKTPQLTSHILAEIKISIGVTPCPRQDAITATNQLG